MSNGGIKMKELDMSKYKPFKVYEGIETRKIKDRIDEVGIL